MVVADSVLPLRLLPREVDVGPATACEPSAKYPSSSTISRERFRETVDGLLEASGLGGGGISSAEVTSPLLAAIFGTVAGVGVLGGELSGDEGVLSCASTLDLLCRSGASLVTSPDDMLPLSWVMLSER